MAKRNRTQQHAADGSSSAGHRLRAELGLTQEELAQLLGVSRVALAKDEGESRWLPAAASQLLNELLRHLLEHPAAPAPPLPPPDAAQRDELDLRLLRLKLDEYPVRQRLARQRTRLAQLRRRQQLGPALRELLPVAPDQHRQLLDILLRQAEGELALDATVPLLLELRLRVIAFERAEIERILAA